MIGRVKCWLDRHDLRLVYKTDAGSRAADVLECRRCGAVRYRIPMVAKR